MVDVDAAPAQLGGQPVRQDLHVAREHDDVGLARRGPISQSLRLLLHLGLLGDRQVVERDAVEIDVLVGLARVIGDDARPISIGNSPLRQR